MDILGVRRIEYNSALYSKGNNLGGTTLAEHRTRG